MTEIKRPDPTEALKAISHIKGAIPYYQVGDSVLKIEHFIDESMQSFYDLYDDQVIKCKEITLMAERDQKREEYINRLMNDSTRIWVCKNCGAELSICYRGKWLIEGDTPPQDECPNCEQKVVLEPKSVILERKIQELTLKILEMDKVRSMSQARRVTTQQEGKIKELKSYIVELIRAVDWLAVSHGVSYPKPPFDINEVK